MEKQKIIDCFTTLAKKWENEGDVYRFQAYNKAIESLNQLKKIEKVEDVIGVPNIGKKSIERIKEILETGKLKELEITGKKRKITDDEVEVVDNFKKVYGVGEITASRWYKSGYRKVEDVPLDICTHIQKIGLKYYHHLNQKLTREDILIFRQKFKPVGKFDIVGSFRRGSETCTNINIILQGSFNWEIATEVLLKKENHVIMICLTNGKYALVDVHIVNEKEYPYARLFFTGSKNYNVFLSLSAKK